MARFGARLPLRLIVCGIRAAFFYVENDWTVASRRCHIVSAPRNPGALMEIPL